jgi:RNase P/RNase MRP subunit p29
VRYAALPAIACLLSASCGYHTAGRADLVPKNIRTVAIPAFGNATTRYKLTDRIPEALAREFIARTRYHVIADQNEADAVLQGSVVNFYAYPIVFDQATARASVVQISVVLSAKLVERATGKTLYSRPSFEMKQQYELSADELAFFEESDTALTRLSRDVARMLVTSILENF